MAEVLQPKVTGDAAQDAWAFDVTNCTNTLAERVDNIEAGGIEGMGVESGNTLPATAEEGDVFALLMTDGSNNPGIYYYNNGAWNVSGGGATGSIGPQGIGVERITAGTPTQDSAGNNVYTATVNLRNPSTNVTSVDTFNFTAPRGPQGEQGVMGVNGRDGMTGPAGTPGQIAVARNTADNGTTITATSGTGTVTSSDVLDGGVRARKTITFDGAVSDIVPTGTQAQYTLEFTGTTTDITGGIASDEQFRIPVRQNFVNATVSDDQRETVVLSGYGDDIDGTYTRLTNRGVIVIIFGTGTEDLFYAQYLDTRFIASQHYKYAYVRADNQRYLYNYRVSGTRTPVRFANGDIQLPASNTSGGGAYIVLDTQLPEGTRQNPPTRASASTINGFINSDFTFNNSVGNNGYLTQTDLEAGLPPTNDTAYTVIRPGNHIRHNFTVTDNDSSARVVFNYTTNDTHTEVQDRRAILEGLLNAVNSGFNLSGSAQWTLTFLDANDSTLDTNQSDVNKYSISSSTEYTPTGNGQNAELTFNEVAGTTTNIDTLFITYTRNGNTVEVDEIMQLSNDTVDDSFIDRNVNLINSVASTYSAVAGPTGTNRIILTSAFFEDATITAEYRGSGSVSFVSTRTRTGASPSGTITQATLTVDGDSIPIENGQGANEVARLVAEYVDNDNYIGAVRGGTTALFVGIDGGAQNDFNVAYTGAPNSLTFTQTFTDGS